MADIFISYARADRDKIEKLAAALETEGYSVWWDRQIVGGAEFSEEIEKELAAAKTVIVAWSADGAKSRWVKDEAGIAANSGKLIALTLDGAEPPIGFKQFHAVDYSRHDAPAYAELKRAVDTNLSGAPAASIAAADVVATQPQRHPKKVLALAGAIVVAGLAVGYYLINSVGNDQTARQQAPSSRVDAAPAIAVTNDYQSIAVLAFADLSAEGDQEYFADGIAEELLNMLARETDLRVAARTSSFAYKGKDDSIASIAEALRVETLLEGSVRKAGDTIRVTAQLIDARSGFHLWSDTYDRELSDIFAIQDEIAAAIVGSLPSTNRPVEDISTPTTNNEAYDLYLQGRHQLARRSRASIEEAVSLLEQALVEDPNFAPAWADLAMATLLLLEGQGSYGDLTLAEVSVIAEPAIQKALALDSTLAEAYAARGLLNRIITRDLYAAVADYRRAIELNPSVANTRHLLYLSLLSVGDFTAAFETIDRAVEHDPLSAITLENHVTSLMLRGRFSEAVTAAERLQNLYPEWHHAKTALSNAYAESGRLADSVKYMKAAALSSGGDNLDVAASFQLIGIKIFDDPFLDKAPVDPATFLDVLQGRAEAARAVAMENLKDNPENPFALWRAVWTQWATGNDQVALTISEDFISRQGEDGLAWAVRPANCYPGLYIAGLRQRAGARETAQPIIEACRHSLDDAAAQGVVLPYYERDMIVELLVLEGRHDEALAELRALVDSGRFFSWWIFTEPIYQPLYDDPRFQKIVADINAVVDRQREEYLQSSMRSDD